MVFEGRLEATVVLLFRASTAAIRFSSLGISAVLRALCVALDWLARRFISFALWAPRIASSIDRWRSYSRAPHHAALKSPLSCPCESGHHFYIIIGAPLYYVRNLLLNLSIFP
jgi:hypothetical protein